MEINGDTSDGYHTFDELYEHRHLLFLNWCLIEHKKAYYKMDPSTPGWFILMMELPFGPQISYHLPDKYLSLVQRCIRDRPAPEFDGHTSKDVLERLAMRLERVAVIRQAKRLDRE